MHKQIETLFEPADIASVVFIEIIVLLDHSNTTGSSNCFNLFGQMPFLIKIIRL